jgi:putative ABC transport system permease protein
MTTPNASFWSIGWRSLLRDWRAGELHVLVLAIALAVAALTAVGFFADRLQNALNRDARQLMGGDAVVRSDQLAPPAFEAQARALGLEVTQHVSFPTMGRADDAQGGNARLVALKAVESNYPLRGQLRITQSPGVPDEATDAVPPLGSAWVDEALLVTLEIEVGQTLWLGDRSFRIDRIITIEPDRGAGFMTFAPRVMIHADDLPATGLVQPASRLNYRLVVAGDDPSVRRFVQWAEAEIARPDVRGVGLESFESGRPEMQQTLQRAEKFLNLVALLAALLSAVAVAIAARVYASRHLDDCAMLRVLGLSQATMARAYTFAFVVVGLVAGFIGVALGYAVHHGFVFLLAELVQADMPAPGAWPALFGLGIGLTLMLAFGLPPVLQLARVPPLRVIRRDVGHLKPASWAVLALGGAGFTALLLLASRDLTLGLIAVGGFAAAVGVFALASYLAVRVLRQVVNESSAPRWLRLATRQVSARPAYAVVQVSALSVGLLALVLLVLLRTDLISSWQQATPPDAPNRFVINIQPEQAEPFQQNLQALGVTQYEWYPMIRGRLVAINGRTITPDDFDGDRAQRLVEREFNLSHSAEAPPSNLVVAGRWQPDEAGAISIEEGLAETLGLRLGDQLTFDIAGIPVESRITSLRRVDWGSMRLNFFAMFPVSQMDDVPLTFVTSYRAPETPGFDNAIVRAFPNVTNVDMTSTIAQVQRVLGQVIRAVEFLFAFTLAAGLVVLFAAVTATRTEREREYAILRAVGAQASLLRQVQRAELLGVGLLAGFLASVVAVIVGWALARYAFEFDWNASPWVPLAGSLAGAWLALAAGWWGLRGVLRTPVVQTLRKAAQ